MVPVFVFWSDEEEEMIARLVFAFFLKIQAHTHAFAMTRRKLITLLLPIFAIVLDLKHYVQESIDHLPVVPWKGKR